MGCGETAASDCKAVVHHAAQGHMQREVAKECNRPQEYIIYSKMHDSCTMVVGIPEDRRCLCNGCCPSLVGSQIVVDSTYLLL